MNHIAFIEKHVIEDLVNRGHSLSVAQGGAFQAVDLYKRLSQATRKGHIFDDVLRHARLWAEKQEMAGKKKPVRKQ